MQKWIKEYIENIDLSKLEWVVFDADALDEFIQNNYFDYDNFNFVCNENIHSVFPTLLGMNYLNLYSAMNKHTHYLLGIVENNIGKRTVVASTGYVDDYTLFQSQKIPFTYIATMEVNSYFRNKNIFKKMCIELAKVVRINQPIITSRESDMGSKCRVFEILKEIFLASGFEMPIIDYNQQDILENYNIVCSGPGMLIK